MSIWHEDCNHSHDDHNDDDDQDDHDDHDDEDDLDEDGAFSIRTITLKMPGGI